MERRLFVGSATVVSLGASVGLSAFSPEIDIEKFEKIQARELVKLEEDMSTLLEYHNCTTCYVSSFLSPAEILKKSLTRDKFYLKYKNVKGEIMSITSYKNRTTLKIGKDFA